MEKSLYKSIQNSKYLVYLYGLLRFDLRGIAFKGYPFTIFICGGSHGLYGAFQGYALATVLSF